MQNHFFKTIALCSLCLMPWMVQAQSVGLAGILGKKAILVIDGADPKSVAVGERLRGFQVLSVGDKEAVVEKNGRKITLRVGQNAAMSAGSVSSAPLTLQADEQGHYFIDGKINEHSIRFLLDTGASAVILGQSLAKKLNLDLSQAQTGYAQTANGKVQTKNIFLSRLQLGGTIELNNVEAHILMGESPHALLGMSALRRLNMNQSGGTMTLSVR